MLLLTAFEPFNSPLNSSEQALRLFLQRHPWHLSGVPVASAILPVAFEDDVRALDQAIALLGQSPRAILHLGQTSGSVVAVEERAQNLRLASDDLARQRTLVAIREGAQDLDSTFPALEIVAALREAQVPCEKSRDAGAYLCNHILFRSLLRAKTTGEATSIGFLHLPRLPEQIEAGEEAGALELDVLARAVEVAARTVVKYLRA